MSPPVAASSSPHALTIAHASAAGEEAAAALSTLSLPNLTRLLAVLRPQRRYGQDEYDLAATHEQVFAADLGWPEGPGALPLAALAAADDGLTLAPDDQPWGRLTPCHWLVGADKITLLDPEALALDEAESRALFDSLRPSFEAEGWALHWGAPLRWYARHPLLSDLPTASLDRVVGRNLDLWLRGGDPRARPLRRLQVEAQMLWHDHPVNASREASGALTVNSFWLSDAGTARPAPDPRAVERARPDLRLRSPLLAGDWAAWCEAWQALDAGPLAELLTAARAGHPVQLTLCGERQAERWHSVPRGWSERLRGLLPGGARADALAVLRSL